MNDGDGEDGAFWLAFLHGLKTRGLGARMLRPVGVFAAARPADTLLRPADLSVVVPILPGHRQLLEMPRGRLGIRLPAVGGHCRVKSGAEIPLAIRCSVVRR